MSQEASAEKMDTPQEPKKARKRPSRLALQLNAPRTPVQILDLVGDYFGITWAELIGKSRNEEIVAARHVAAWFMHQAGMGFSAVGRALGGRDHSTAKSAIERIEREMQNDPDVARTIRAIADRWKETRA